MRKHLLWYLIGRHLGTLTRAFGSSHFTNPAYQERPTCHSSLASDDQLSVFTDLTHLKFLTESRKILPRYSERLLYRIKLFVSGSYPWGNFGRNQLLGGSISLSPLWPCLRIDLRVITPSDLQRAFARLHPAQLKFTAFRVPTSVLFLKTII